MVSFVILSLTKGAVYGLSQKLKGTYLTILCLLSKFHAAVKEKPALNMFSAQTRLPVPFSSSTYKEWFKLLESSLFYFNFWVELLKFKVALSLCFFEDVLSMLHILLLPVLCPTLSLDAPVGLLAWFVQ